jgi:hypothetical protein
MALQVVPVRGAGGVGAGQGGCSNATHLVRQLAQLKGLGHLHLGDRLAPRHEGLRVRVQGHGADAIKLQARPSRGARPGPLSTRSQLRLP